MLHRAVWYKLTDVSEVLTSPIIREKMEAGTTSETSGYFYETTRSNFIEDSHLHVDDPLKD
jgi:hypothetical protein